MSACPCGGTDYETCCGPRHSGVRPAETAEALMRSRYSAFARGLGEYLAATGSTDSAASLSQWSRSVTWLGLQVLETEAGSANDSTGRVRFLAGYLEAGKLCELSEFSHFSRVDGRWRYDNGDTSFTTREVERNESCPCGSGRKFKKCHAA